MKHGRPYVAREGREVHRLDACFPATMRRALLARQARLAGDMVQDGNGMVPQKDFRNRQGTCHRLLPPAQSAPGDEKTQNVPRAFFVREPAAESRQSIYGKSDARSGLYRPLCRGSCKSWQHHHAIIREARWACLPHNVAGMVAPTRQDHNLPFEGL